MQSLNCYIVGINEIEALTKAGQPLTIVKVLVFDQTGELVITGFQQEGLALHQRLLTGGFYKISKLRVRPTVSDYTRFPVEVIVTEGTKLNPITPSPELAASTRMLTSLTKVAVIEDHLQQNAIIGMGNLHLQKTK